MSLAEKFIFHFNMLIFFVCFQLLAGIQMTGYLLDDPRFMDTDKERKEKVNKVFSDVEQLQKEAMLSERYC